MASMQVMGGPSTQTEREHLPLFSQDNKTSQKLQISVLSLFRAGRSLSISALHLFCTSSLDVTVNLSTIDLGQS